MKPGFRLLECNRQNFALVFCKHNCIISSWARILNVQNLMKERTKKTSTNITSTFIPSTTIATLTTVQSVTPV